MTDSSPTPAAMAKAEFVPDSGSEPRDPVPVHFNPASLQHTVSNTLRTGRGAQTQQYVTHSTAKLSMDLVFDTTGTGDDVRTVTGRIAGFMEPNNEHVPPRVTFRWGAYEFSGMLESFRETLDFFAPSGVPLRSSVNVTLAKQEEVFQTPAGQGVGVSNEMSALMDEAVDVPPSTTLTPGNLASQAGDAGAAAEIASQNGLESLRGAVTSGLTVTRSVSRSGATAFSSAVTANTVVSLPAAFDELRQVLPRSVRLDPDRLRARMGLDSVATDAGAVFQTGGRAAMQSSSNERADVGASASLKDLLDFDED
jgi:hypothetical protein